MKHAALAIAGGVVVLALAAWIARRREQPGVTVVDAFAGIFR